MIQNQLLQNHWHDTLGVIPRWGVKPSAGDPTAAAARAKRLTELGMRWE
ncbi:hypothetical protein ACFVVX_36160 [Kitasatospora sp. NPDC058170]